MPIKFQALIIVPIVALSFLHGKAGQIIFKGNNYPVYEIEPSSQSGLNKLFVCHDLHDVSIIYRSDNTEKTEWSKFSNMGGAYSEIINNIEYSGNESVLTNPEGGYGYIIKDGDSTVYFWLIDYSHHEFKVKTIFPKPDQDCEYTYLGFEGSADPIYYYGINGRREQINREIPFYYYNLTWDENKENFQQEQIFKNLVDISDELIISPPVYCNTTFTIEEDRFMKFWGEKIKIVSEEFHTESVNSVTKATQINSDGISDNQIKTDSDGLGGSAPAEIEFEAFVTDAVRHNEWQISMDADFNLIDYRITEQDFSYTFNNEGTFFVRYIGSNSDGSCETISETYQVTIGSSELLIPNAFTPNDDGINDIWKVSYRSLIEFKCWIFDRNGHQIYYFDDPQGGWDGKRNGKTVRSGVYYYVIQAVGSDGKKYKKSGDINIIGLRENNHNYSEE